MADPGAEAYLTANGWALFRELLSAGGARDAAVQDAYVARMARPGAVTKGGMGQGEGGVCGDGCCPALACRRMLFTLRRTTAF